MIKVTAEKGLNTEGFRSYVSSERKDVYAAALKLVVDDITKGINNGVAVTGGGFPSLEPETIRRKGHSNALIDKGLLRDTWTYEQLNQWRQNYGQITVKDRSRGGDTSRKRVAQFLQMDGIRSKSGQKRFFFFGISRDAERDILMLFDKYILNALEAL